MKKTPDKLDNGDKVRLNDAVWVVQGVKSLPEDERRPGAWFDVQLVPEDREIEFNPKHVGFIAPSDYEFEVENIMTKNEIAKVTHEANRAICTAFGDTSQTPWEDAPEWQRESALEGVQLHIDNSYMPASSSHDAWCKHKRDNGWTYGPTKDPDAKTHPCLVPFDQLPGDQQAKDYVFAAIVRSLKKHLTD